MIFDDLELLLEQERERLEGLGVSYLAARGPAERSPSALIVDLESSDRDARIVVWSDGQAQLNAGNLATQEVLIDQYVRDVQVLGLARVLASVTDLLI